MHATGMANASGPSVSPTENQEASNTGPNQDHQITSLPPSTTTIAGSDSSSHNELHRTLNGSEGDQFLSTDLEGHQQPDVIAEEQNVTLDRPQLITTLSSFLQSHNDLHQAIDKPADHDADGITSEVTLAFDANPEEQQISDKETKERGVRDTDSKEFGDDGDTLREKSGLERGAESPSNAMLVDEKDEEYIRGPKLYLVLSALTMVYFIVMLDNTILATVSVLPIPARYHQVA